MKKRVAYTKNVYIFFSIIISKNITTTRCYFIFPVPGKKLKNKLKQSETEGKIIIKIEKHNSCSNWQIVFMSDNDKQTLTGIYEILIVKNLKAVHKIF